ncbi:MAG: YHS domain-containing protein [Chloracidobacterium sp.]|nr:YHS domain-containing protein [Chloracidobacterium sp.]MDW8216295.1 YHS domain-containing protein [Acidobacteriota bacterium]
MFRVFRALPLTGLGCLLLCSTFVSASPQSPTQAPAATAPSDKPICPVTLEEVEDTAAAAHSDYRGKRYYFCCPACKPKFDKNPRKYLRAMEAKQRRTGKQRSR